MTQSRLLPNETTGQASAAEFLHDLRTPLNQILGFCEMLTEQAQDEGQPGFLPDLQSIHTAGKELLALLNQGFPYPGASPQTERGLAASDSAPVFPPPAGTSESGSPDPLRPRSNLFPGEARDRAGAEACILVVDDVRANRDVLSRRLEKQGHRVVMAENGRQAMEKVREQAFDLVLLDIMMPEMDGYSVLQQLKAEEALRPIPVIMITALTELDSVVRCIELGADDYLPKPFNPVLLKARIGACLEKKRAHDRELQLFQELQQNYKRLQELETQRDDLTHMIVHDLRTPLTSIITGMQTLEALGEMDAVQQEMVGISLSGGEMLLGMINDLLDVDKMESGSMPIAYAPLDAADLVAVASGQVASLCESKKISLVRRIAADLPPFQGDAGKLRRVLVNLLGNAVKFTPEGGTLTTEARLGEDGRSLVFAVSDTGEGIPAEAFGRIFEKFGQVESRRGGRTMSTGLGLTFCKLAVEAHGGGIGVASIPGQGSTFSFTIPLAVDTPPIGPEQAAGV